VATPATERCKKYFTAGRPNDCWPWTGAISPYGYGLIGRPGPSTLAHRVVYEALRGEPVPLESDLDHTCHTADEACVAGRACVHRRCVNPNHLEIVTSAENMRRSGERRRRCPKGHIRTGSRAFNGRTYCKVCEAERQVIVRAERKAGLRADSREITCNSCKQRMPVCARGMCRRCYTNWYRGQKGAAARPGRLKAKESAKAARA
jgi:hypothetical protein